MLSPGAIFLILLIIGIAAGLLFDRFAGPGWLSRQIAGSNRLMVTSSLVGIRIFRRLSSCGLDWHPWLWRAHLRHHRRRRGLVGVAHDALISATALRLAHSCAGLAPGNRPARVDQAWRW